MTDIVYNKNGVPFDIDNIATDLNGKMDKDGVNATCSICIENWHDNNGNWYRIYSDGWCEQGGQVNADNDAAYNVTLLKTMPNTKYLVFVQREGDYSSNINGRWAAVYNKTTTGFTTWGKYGGLPTSNWRACGYIR